MVMCGMYSTRNTELFFLYIADIYLMLFADLVKFFSSSIVKTVGYEVHTTSRVLRSLVLCRLIFLKLVLFGVWMNASIERQLSL